MSVTIETKVDLLLKKLLGVARTSANKDINNESISSPSLNRGNSIWLNSYLIPKTAASQIGTVESLYATNRIKCEPDRSSPDVNGVYLTWLTNKTDWIPPEFDDVNSPNTYRIKVYYGPPDDFNDVTQIYASGTYNEAEFFFDYQAGVLNFYGGSTPSLMSSTHVIYIEGYRYVGPIGFNSIFKVDLPVMRSDTSLPTLITLKGDFVIEKDLEIQGADLTTNQTVFNLLNTNATTINFAGAATEIEIGSSDEGSVININSEEVSLVGKKLTTDSEEFDLLNDTATIINFAGAATQIEIGSSDEGSVTNINSEEVSLVGKKLTTDSGEFDLLNDTATVINFAGAATQIEIGSSDEGSVTNINSSETILDGDLEVKGGDITTDQNTFNLLNTNATTINFAGQATNIEIGSEEGVTNVNNNLKVDGDTTFGNRLTVDGDTTFGNRLTVDGIVDVNNSLYVEGEARVSSNLEVEDSMKVQNELAVEGDTQITRDLNVGGYIKAGKLVDTMIDCGEY